MKCSDCVFCKTQPEFYKCDNPNSNANQLQIFNPENAGCASGVDGDGNRVEYQHPNYNI